MREFHFLAIFPISLFRNISSTHNLRVLACFFLFLPLLKFHFIKWKWKSLSCVWLFVTPMDDTVHGILQTRILEWVAVPFSRGSSPPRDQTQVSHIAGGFFTSWATREFYKGMQQIHLHWREKEIAIRSNILAWETPWTEEAGRLQSMESQRIRHNWATKQPQI